MIRQNFNCHFFRSILKLYYFELVVRFVKHRGTFVLIPKFLFTFAINKNYKIMANTNKNDKLYTVKVKNGGTIKDGMESIIEILSAVNSFAEKNHSSIIYRGISQYFYQKVPENQKNQKGQKEQENEFQEECIRSGEAVRLDPTENRDYTYSDYISYLRGLITDVKRNYPDTYSGWSDLEILGDLQHNGAATCLVDFSRNILISLWFACGGNDVTKPDSKKKKKLSSPTADKFEGILYCYDVRKDLIEQNNLKIIKESDLKKPIENLLVETKPVTNYCSDTDYSFFMWTPSNLNSRIARQDSVFVFGLPKFIVEEHNIFKIVIPSVNKKAIKMALEFFFDITDNSIFNDRHGFATVNDKLSTFPLSADKYEQGLQEMFKGNFRTALEFFIMRENEDKNYQKIKKKTNKAKKWLEENKKKKFEIKLDTEAEIDYKPFIEWAELHLSKAICYKNRESGGDEEANAYSDNAIWEYVQARDAYMTALMIMEKNETKYKEELKIYTNKLLRTCNDEIHLLYLKKEYRRCINAFDKAIKLIERFNNIEGISIKKTYCIISKLELLQLIIFEEEKFEKYKEEWDKKEFEKYKEEWVKMIGAAENVDHKSEFDKKLVRFFEKIWEGIKLGNNNDKTSNGKDFKEEVGDLIKEIETAFNAETKDEVPYSSWDFTEIKEAIAKTNMLKEENKVALQKLVAFMISIRDKYNVRELNTNRASHHLSTE